MALTWTCNVAGRGAARRADSEDGGGTTRAEASCIGHGEDEPRGCSHGEGERKGPRLADVCVWGDGDVAGGSK